MSTDLSPGAVSALMVLRQLKVDGRCFLGRMPDGQLVEAGVPFAERIDAVPAALVAAELIPRDRKDGDLSPIEDVSRCLAELSAIGLCTESDQLIEKWNYAYHRKDGALLQVRIVDWFGSDTGIEFCVEGHAFLGHNFRLPMRHYSLTALGAHEAVRRLDTLSGGQAREGEPDRSKVRAAIGWIHDHYLAPLIVVLIAAVLLVLLGLTP
jgi:hypothetical protein